MCTGVKGVEGEVKELSNVWIFYTHLVRSSGEFYAHVRRDDDVKSLLRFREMSHFSQTGTFRPEMLAIKMNESVLTHSVHFIFESFIYFILRINYTPQLDFIKYIYAI